MGAVFRSKGQFAEGLLACQRAMKLDPATYVGHRMAGLCCLGLRRYDEAIAYFEFAASAMESDFTASTFISQCYKAKGDLDRMRGSTLRAMDRIEKIVMADPGHSRAIGMGVAMLADLGEKERAREWATRARLVDPEAVNLQYNLACAMSSLGETDLALEALEGIASKLSPGMVSWLEADTDLDPVREEPRFKSMMDEVKSRFAKS
jgi:adenylate cyclase